MWPTSKTDATEWNLLWTILSTLDAGWKGSLVWYLSTVKPKLLLAKAVQHWSIPGLYSGIFAIYPQHYGSQQSTDRTNNIIFYALWALYALTTATIIIDMLMSFWIVSGWPSSFDFVSISFTEHRDSVSPWNYRRHIICFVWRHCAIYPSTSNW